MGNQTIGSTGHQYGPVPDEVVDLGRVLLLVFLDEFVGPFALAARRQRLLTRQAQILSFKVIVFNAVQLRFQWVRCQVVQDNQVSSGSNSGFYLRELINL